MGSEGVTIVMKLRKLTQLTHEERKSARQRHGRERERLGEMSYDEREGERERERDCEESEKEADILD